jgi:two-component system OmpR family sensor kinase
MSIRLRVTLVTVILVALALATADFTAYSLLRRAVYRDANTSVHNLAASAVAAVGAGGRLDLSILSVADRPVWVRLLASDGRPLQQISTRDLAGIKLPIGGLLKTPGRSQLLFDQKLDAIAVPAGHGETVVAAVALGPTAKALTDLSKLNDLIGVAVLALSAVVAAIVLTLGLRPLRRIVATADAIAAGSLGERAPAEPKKSEIGRVGIALNRMLDEIQAAFAQRDATERRLRRFLADVSHELRTPLTSIRGYAELFRHGAERRPEDLAHAMRAIEDEAARMAHLVEDLLLLARLDDERPLRLGPVALDEVVASAIEAAKVIDRERPLACHLERPTIVDGDAVRLRQLIDNLLTNARRHTPVGTAVSVALARVGGEAVLTVADAGPGIAPADRERLFDRFFRPDGGRSRDRGGAGLGLAIVQAIAVAHHGHVSVRDADPHGALFEVRLPLSAGSGASPF